MSNAVEIEIDAQYRQLREECGLLERDDRALLRVSGPNAAEYLQGQLTNDVEALEPGEGQHSTLLDRKGRIQADLRVLRPLPEEVLLETEPESRAAAFRHLGMYSVGREVEIADVSDEHTVLSLIGPRAVEIAGTAALPEDFCEPARVGGVDCLAAGGREGVDLIAPRAEAARVLEALREAGAVPISAAAAEILRVEAGVPRFGAEIGPETMPAEAGIVERAVSFTKGCYIGQETVARLHYKGRPNRHLRGLRLSAPAAPGASVRLGEKEVGRLGGAVVSPTLGPVGLAILRREAEPGAEVAVGEDGVTAEVIDLPFG